MNSELTVSEANIKRAVLGLRDIYKTIGRDTELTTLANAQSEVLARYQPIFSLDHVARLTVDEFKSFLLFKNNQHWSGLHRATSSICSDIRRLRRALSVLLDESKDIVERLDFLLPKGESPFVPKLGKAVLTAILLVAFPEKYGVYNGTSEAAMMTLGIWPTFERGAPFSARYMTINNVLRRIASDVPVDLWTLDALWWRVSPSTDIAASQASVLETSVACIDDAQAFGLERHLHEFLRDNWEKTTLGKQWALYEEDGDADAGYEYPCAVGRIDLLARHRKEKKWLIVELKRAQSSDNTVGQVLRYMGWVREHLASKGEDVEGLIVAHQADESIEYAVRELPNVSLRLYDVKFELRPPPPRN